MKKQLKTILSLLCAATFVITPLTTYENEMPIVSITAEAATKLSAPENVSAEKTATSVTLKWDSVKGADAYRVYKYDEKTKEFVKYKNVISTSCKVTGLSKNTKYYFKVATLTKVNDKFSEQGITGKISVTTKANDTSASVSENYTGFKTSDGKKYYYENGKLITGFKKIGSDKYYFTKSGMVTGWLEYYGLYYYFDNEGKMVRNKTVSISGTKYTFDSDGVWEYDSDIKAPKANYTVKGDKLDISIWMSSETDSNSPSIVMRITNNGDKDLTILPIGFSYDKSFSKYDRALLLLNNSYKFDGKSQVIKAGSSEWVQFACYSMTTYKPSYTWYDKKTTAMFSVKYDKTTYTVSTSSYYGTSSTVAHENVEKVYNDLIDALS